MRFVITCLLLGAGLALPATLIAATFNVPAPASLSLTSAPGGMRVVYQGATNFKYQVQVSSNLIAWSLLASNVATNRTTAIIDTESTNRQMRFYKANSLVTPFFYQGTFSGAESGSFILLARTNDTAVFMGINTTAAHRRGEYAASMVVGGDDSACGGFIAGTTGCVQFAGSSVISGRFTNGPAGTTGTLTGVQKANLGLYSGSAGLYAGTVSTPHTGTARLLLCPDGSYAFYRNDPYAGRNDGGVAVLPANGTVDVYLSGSVIMHLAGSFNKATRVFSVTIHELDGLISTASLTYSEPVF